MTTKRQLGLAEAFLNAQQRASTPPAKRARLSAAAPLSTAAAATVAGAAGQAGQAEAVEPTASTSSISSSPFSPSSLLSSLSSTGSSPTESDLLALECATLHPSWLEHLRDEIRKPYFLDLKRFLWKEGLKGEKDREGGKLKVFPPARDVYAWSRYTPLQDVKVVILGQDPYHDDGQAHGLCFSVRPGVKIPPSLRNIYKEIKEEYPAFDVPKHGNLISWARSGVLLLNTSLTVSPHKAGSHSNRGWEDFTDKVIELVDKHAGASEDGKKGKGVVVLAWGAWAAKRVAKMDKKKHLILTSAHPSPLSARRGFFGNSHFRKANEWLQQKYGPDAGIEWTKLDIEVEETGVVKDGDVV
ncbi:uracil DNA glycosylase [Rhodotorula toruloides]|uniref:Uracil-DNA glycosylase n=2 Tax=Rhodotorula toruloides TaxID=5286 RepID=A0A061B9F8_RHOTO|nr:uracil-DNA glycosylase [Rhodotorula toruloides NP11]EMS23062.1 uracil-DNA glycosylase [Rhodotorula toruloides NP11]CDR46558.1 RHTO0S12e06282g1_1 [Rhodotorula toruloides]